MKLAIVILEDRITAAMAAATDRDDCVAMVKSSTDPKFGDYQANGVMALAKKLKTNPRKLAEEVVKNLDVSDICESPEIAGPGFINLRLKSDFLADRLLEINADHNNLGIDKTNQPKTIVVDFSGPNIAKQMHVGHLRSTIIGDCICRVLEFLGHKIIPQNHVGDWGTNFGMVILGLWHICMAEERNRKNPYYKSELQELKTHTKDKNSLEVVCRRIRNRHEEDWREDFLNEPGDGERRFMPFLKRLKEYDQNKLWGEILCAYQYVNLLEESLIEMVLIIPTRKKKKNYKEDENPFDYISIPYESLSRHITAYYLQNIDDEDNKQERNAWERIREISLKHGQNLYDTLRVTLTKEDIRGESEYRGDLHDVVEDLKNLPETRISDGAVCVFPEGFKNKEGQPLPLIVQKSDGAYLYATTDLAAIRYRVGELKAQRIIYVTDARQKLHFEMVFAVAHKVGWAKDDTELIHVTFGSVLGENGQPLKTRSGENVKLKELLNEAVERAKAVVEEKNPDLDENKKAEIAKAVGIGAVKYADYSNNRISDYIFSFDKMLAMDGNTAPYMQYAYARIRSIERKADFDIKKEIGGIEKLSLTEPAEMDLAKHLIRYGEAIESAAVDYRPNYLTAYLYELAQKFSAFYTNCPVLNANPNKRPTRLLLCDLTARTIEHGLNKLLGIEVVEQM